MCAMLYTSNEMVRVHNVYVPMYVGYMSVCVLLGEYLVTEKKISQCGSFLSIIICFFFAFPLHAPELFQEWEFQVWPTVTKAIYVISDSE